MFRPVLVTMAAAGLALASSVAAQPAPAPSIVGAWTLNAELSDGPPARRPEGDQPEGRGGGRGGRGSGGPGDPGGGGFGRGGGGRGGFSGGRGGRGNPDEMRRRMDAMRDLLEVPERMTIVRTDSMVIITAGDGRTTRLATDNSRVKDESTGIERRTRWEGEKLVSDISGAMGGKMTETYAIDSESQRLVVTVQMERAGRRDDDDRGQDPGAAGPGGGIRRHVYDLAKD